MYIWKEALHGNRHADQDADNRACQNLKETDTIFGVFL